MKGRRKKCPECGKEMHIERFIDGDGNKQAIWWCAPCGEALPFKW